MLARLLIAAAAIFGATAAQAEWREASSRNFIVYSDTSEANLREFAEKLEKFDFILRRVHNVQRPPSPNRLRVFLLGSTSAVGNMVGSSSVAGYYVRDARGMMMVGTRASRNQPIDSEVVLLHEYTHHFMNQYFPATYPTWYSEGFAEFWGETRFLDNNVVELGHPSRIRFESFERNRWLHVRELLTAQSYADVGEVDLLYAAGWLLVRYTWDNAERRRQLQQYLALVNDGMSYADASTRAFGDLNQLNSELYEYASRRRWNVVQLPFRQFDIGQIAVRTLGPAEQALIEYEIRLSQGVPSRDFTTFAETLRGAAARFPDDPFALRLLAETERIANNDAAAMAAVDRLLRVAPDDPRGLMHKAMLQIEALRAAGSTDQATWNSARQLLVRASELNANDPLLFEAYYDSFAAQGVTPPEHAQGALYRAHELAPSDGDLRYKLASDFEQRGMVEDAIAIIRPEAYRVPSRREETDRQRERRQRLEDRYRRAGTTRRETAREMLARLQSRRPAGN